MAKEFEFNQVVNSDDHCVQGIVVFNEKGEAHVAYYTDSREVKLIKIDYSSQFHDWEIVKEK